MNVLDQIPNGVERERGLDELSEPEMVISLVEKQRRGTDEAFLAFGVSGLEEVGLSHKHELGRLWARQHHTRTPQDMGLEDLAVPDDRYNHDHRSGEHK